MAVRHPPRRKPEELRIGVALSGGGYRATLHALGALRALHDAGFLDQVEVVSGVSGGALTAALFGAWMAGGRSGGFGAFEGELLDRVASLELPRTLLVIEFYSLLAGGIEATAHCVAARAVGSVGALADRLRGAPQARHDEAVASCATQRLEHHRENALGLTLRDWSGDCDSATLCHDGPPSSIAGLLGFLGARLVLGEDNARDVKATLCEARRLTCLHTGEAPASQHLLSALLDTLFFEREGRPLAMADLREPGAPHIALSATSTRHGDLWVASTHGAGVPGRVSHRDRATYRAYGGGDRGPLVAKAVAASACYPVFCSPVEWASAAEPGRSELLTDGGVFDNLGVRGLQAVLDATEEDVDIILVANARRPFAIVDGTASRLATLMHLHDMMIDQRSADTLRDLERDDADRGRCPHVEVALSGPDHERLRLSSLPTDLRPLGDLAAALLHESAAAFRQELQRNPCLQ